VRTIAALWEQAVSNGGGSRAFLVEERDGWRAVSWQDAGAAVDEVAAGLLALGVEPADRVAIASRTRFEWTLCDLALASIGAISVPIYPTSSTEETVYILENSEALVAVCEDAAQTDKIAPVRERLEGLRQLVVLEGESAGAIGLGDLRERGRTYAADHPGIVAERRRRVGENDVLTIIYTSGTTGPPKGCVITQRNFWVMVDMVRRVEGFLYPEDTVFLYLPLAHNFARLCQYAGVGIGFALAFCPDIARIPEALASVRPTILPSVPRVYEKIYAGVTAAFAEATGPKRKLVDWALRVGRQASQTRAQGRRPSGVLSFQVALADRLVYSKVKARLGGRVRIAISGGAPLGKEIIEFFDSLGLLILEGYGQTECTSASHLNPPNRHRFGTVGLPLPGVEAALAADGEVLLRGGNVFAGYYGDEEATSGALTPDGWLATGDVGSIDADGYLTIVDRKKDIIITSGGKNLAPQNIERALERSPLVARALVVGDRRPYVTALLTIDREQAERAGLGGEPLRTALAEVVATANRDLGRVEQVKRFAVLGRDFLLEQGELTPTLKLRRHVCEEHFRDEIERLYSSADSVPSA
jgi:long-chain acyl-CoA synthetase